MVGSEERHEFQQEIIKGFLLIVLPVQPGVSWFVSRYTAPREEMWHELDPKAAEAIAGITAWNLDFSLFTSNGVYFVSLPRPGNLESWLCG